MTLTWYRHFLRSSILLRLVKLYINTDVFLLKIWINCFILRMSLTELCKKKKDYLVFNYSLLNLLSTFEMSSSLNKGKVSTNGPWFFVHMCPLLWENDLVCIVLSYFKWLYTGLGCIWVRRRVSYKKQELIPSSASTRVHPPSLGGVCLAHLFFFFF